MGRPSLLTAKRAQTVVQVLAQGGTNAEAARRAGVSPRTLRMWLQRGRERDGTPEARLAGEVGRAVYDAALARWKAIRRGDWRVAAEWLERRYPRRWAPRETSWTGRSAEPVTDTVSRAETHLRAARRGVAFTEARRPARARPKG